MTRKSKNDSKENSSRQDPRGWSDASIDEAIQYMEVDMAAKKLMDYLKSPKK